MIRSLKRFQQSLDDHHRWQFDYFTTIRNKKLERIKEFKLKGELDKALTLQKEVDKMKFQFNRKECMINFGHCSKFDKPVTFIPNTCQLDTQICFSHRNDSI